MPQPNIESIYRLSPIQEGILFHSLESAITGVYFEQFSCSIQGLIDHKSYVKAWQSVVQRHSVLRTLFTWERRDQPLQLVRKNVALPLQELDWTGHLKGDPLEQRWAALLQRDRERGFDLEQAPLFRLTLVKTEARETRLLWSFHHLILDGWSMRLILDEVMTFYQAFTKNTPAELSPVVPFENFIRFVQTIDHEQEQAHWSESLCGFSIPTNPLSDCSARKDRMSNLVSQVTTIEIPDSQRSRLEEFAKARHLTLNTIAVGAWAIVLGRYCNSRDVVFGTTVSGRSLDLEDADRIAGLLINTLPFRAKIPSQANVSDWLREIQRQQLKLREFEQSSLAEIQKCSDLPAGNGLFDTILVFENFPPASRQSGSEDLQCTDPSYIEYSHFSLAILVVPGNTLELMAVHNPQRYTSAFVHRMLCHMRALILDIVVNPDLNIEQLSMISETERALLIDRWNQTGVAFPEAISIHRKIEQCAKQSVDVTAIVSDAARISYRELNARANQLARYLGVLGVDKQIAVPVIMDRCSDAVVAILAILKAGSAYVPIDPAFPTSRISLIYKDLLAAAAADPDPVQNLLVICDRETLHRLPEQTRSICPDRDDSIIAGFEETNLDIPVSSDQLAYIIYTSGSTGQPKGVMVNHSSLLNSTLARSAYYPEQIRAYLLLSSLATDSSVAGLFWSLCSGATLVLPPARVEQDIYNLLKLVDEERISHLLCLPSLYQLILDHAADAVLHSIKVVLVAGEACHRDLIDSHLEQFPDTALYNEYGPTEACVWTSVARLDTLTAGQRVSIGRPISNHQLYVLDPQKQLLPIGVAGELFIGGAGLAQGYLNQPDKTAEKFVENPFDSTGESLLYRTGDRVRYLPDGNLEFLGRIDNQVKIRGFRVELGEIEETLSRHPQIKEVIVLLEQHRPESVDIDHLTNALLAHDSEYAETTLSAIEQMDPIQVASALTGSL